jgi:hypothetical protein
VQRQHVIEETLPAEIAIRIRRISPVRLTLPQVVE